MNGLAHRNTGNLVFGWCCTPQNHPDHQKCKKVIFFGNVYLGVCGCQCHTWSPDELPTCAKCNELVQPGTTHRVCPGEVAPLPENPQLLPK